MLRRVLGLASLALLAALPAAADEAADQQKAIEAIRKAGGNVPRWTTPTPAGRPVRVDLGGDKATDADLAHVRRLTKLRKLYLTDVPITDAGLADVEDLTRLEVLDLAGTELSPTRAWPTWKTCPGSRCST